MRFIGFAEWDDKMAHCLQDTNTNTHSGFCAGPTIAMANACWFIIITLSWLCWAGHRFGTLTHSANIWFVNLKVANTASAISYPYNFYLFFCGPQTIETWFSGDAFEKGCFQKTASFSIRIALRWAGSSLFAYTIMNTQFCPFFFEARIESEGTRM